MAVRFARTDLAMLACVGLLGTAGFFGFSAAFNARSGLSAIGPSSKIERGRIEVSASDAVNLRFPSDWAEAPSTAPATMALASADAGIAFLDPRPLYVASVGGVEEPEAAAVPVSVAPAAAAIPRPARPVHRSNAVLNESQIASIKKRLNLTRDQERYWPAVAAELRKMEYKKDTNSPGSRTAAIDMSKVNMEGLKSAGFPLVMSFNDDQRRELKSLAHLLGLEGAMSSL
jgi:hypothetical protein